MDVTRRSSFNLEKLYIIDTKTILAQRDSWEIWKKIKGSWELMEEVKRKDYSQYVKKSTLTTKDLYTFETEYFTITSLLDLEEVDKEEEKLLKKYNKILAEREQEQERELLRTERVRELDNTIRDLKKELLNIETETLNIEDIKTYQVYINNIILNLKNNKIKDTKTTREVNKINRLELYKVEIHNYIRAGRYKSINKLCKDLGINRKTFYNLKLNEEIK